MSYKLGSLFDGSGGFPLAGSICGIEPRWASEVEPYPIAVTRERFPNMKHLGDISKINGAEVEPVDIITFGSPCQDLSVAGKRAGLKHEANGDEETTRSGLFMEAVRIIKEMRAATNGQYPRFALWENVPGAFSSNKGEDFRVVCEELIKIVEPSAFMPEVPKNGWAYADSYVGDGWSLAYRVFDAQYWGVPQRRRRIHLVADFRGECARQVLFERDGVRGYFTQSGTQRQTAAADIEGSTGATDREIEGFDGYNGDLTGDKSATLGVNCGMSIGRNEVIEKCVGIDAYNQALTGDKSMTIRAMRSDNEHIPLVCYKESEAPAYCIGNGQVAQTRLQEKVGTLNCMHDQQAVMYWDGSQTTGTLTANNAGGNQRMPDKENFNCVIEQRPVVYSCDEKMGQTYVWEEQANTLAARDYKQPQAVCYGAPPHYIVRRLTPTECARLQGFADRWGHIEQKTELTDEEFRFWQEVRNTHAAINGKKVQNYTEKQMLTWYNKLWTDSAEYKMWGNGIALPPALYCMQGIIDVLTGASEKQDDISADLVDDLNRQNSEAVAETEEAAEGEPTDLSDAPEAIKVEIIDNDNKLQEQEKETTEEPIMDINDRKPEPTEETIFDAVEQLTRLANERKALANLKPNDKRFSDEVRAIEYAVSVLKAVGL